MWCNVAGDERDFGKFGLLRQLCHPKFVSTHSPLLFLGVVWYLTKWDEPPSPGGIDYLFKPREYRKCDCELFDALESIVASDNRSVAALEKCGRIFPAGAKFFRPLVPPLANRGEWRRDALCGVEAADVVFLDPDIGMVPSHDRRYQSSVQHADWEEAAMFWKHGKSLVIYQQANWSVQHPEQVRSILSRARQGLEISDDDPVFVLRFGRGVPFTFFLLIPKKQHAEQFEAVAKRMIQGEWQRHFFLWTQECVWKGDVFPSC